MSITKEDLKKLADPMFHKELFIEPMWRVGDSAGAGKNVIFPYYTADQCREILDAVCGITGWSNEYREVRGYLFCSISMTVDGDFIEKADSGGARSTNKDLKGADKETFEAKTAASSAFVRAATAWGIGRHLALLPKVILKNAGKGSVVTESGEVLSTPEQLTAYCNGISTSKGWLASIYRANKSIFDNNPRLIEAIKTLNESL